MFNFLKKNKFLVLILFLTFLLRLPSLFEPYWYGDEGVYLTLGMSIRRGLLLYKDIFDNKPPLIYLLAALAGNLFWLRFILLVSCLGSLILISNLTKLFFPKNNLAQRVTILFFAFFSSIPLIEGNIANSEIFQILPIMGGIYLLFKNKKPSMVDFFMAPATNLFISGTLFSLATLFKVPAIFDLVAVIIFLIFNYLSKKIFSFNLPKILSFLIGFSLPILISLIFFFFHHYLKEFIQITFFQNLGYLSSWKTGSHQFSLMKSNLFIKSAIILLLLFILFYKQRKSPLKMTLFCQIWFLFSFFAALLSNRPYAHYLIQVLPSFCLLMGILISQRGFVRLSSIFLIMVFLVISFCLKFWIYPVFSYYQNFLDFSLGRKDRASYFSYFDKKTPQIYEISSYLVRYSHPSDKIFIWGDEPYIYALSQRLPATRFTVAYHIIDFKKFTEVEKDLIQNPPKVIILKSQKNELSPALENLLNTNYLKIKKVGDFQILRKGEAI